MSLSVGLVNSLRYLLVPDLWLYYSITTGAKPSPGPVVLLIELLEIELFYLF